MPGNLINPAAASAGTGLSPGRSFGSGIGSSLGSAVGSAVSAFNPLLGQLIGSGSEFLMNLLSKNYDNRLSKDLYDYQTDYGKLMRSMQAAGINPGAAAQGLSNATPSMSAVSGHAAPSLSGLGSMMLEQQRNPSVIAKNQADTMLAKARVGEIGQLLDWNPRRWQAEIDLAKKQADLFGSQSIYYDEMVNSIRQKRPWEIGQLQHGLQVMSAQISQYLAAAGMMKKQGEYYGELSKGQKKINFINGIKASFWRDGINPDEPPLRSLFRLTMKNPKAAEGIINKELQFLGIIDGKITDSLGKNWKKYAAAGMAMHYINNRLGEHATKRSARNADRMRTLVGLMSVAGSVGTGSPAPAMLSVPYLFSDPSMSSSYGIPFGSTNMW